MLETANVFRREPAESIEFAPRIDTHLDAALVSRRNAGGFDLSAIFVSAQTNERTKWPACERRVRETLVVGTCNDSVYRRAGLRDAAGNRSARLRANRIFRTVRVRGMARRARYIVVATATKRRTIGFHFDCVGAINGLLITRLSFRLRCRDGRPNATVSNPLERIHFTIAISYCK